MLSGFCSAKEVFRHQITKPERYTFKTRILRILWIRRYDLNNFFLRCLMPSRRLRKADMRIEENGKFGFAYLSCCATETKRPSGERSRVARFLPLALCIIVFYTFVFGKSRDRLNNESIKMTLDDSIHNRQGSFLFDFCIKHLLWTSLSADFPSSAFLLPYSEKTVDVSLSPYVLYKGRKRDQKNGIAQLYGKGNVG